MQVEKKKQTLDAATEAFQFFSDCNETESVIKEFITLAKSKVNTVCNILLHVITVLSPRHAQDFGQDKLTAVSLLGRHKHLQDKVQSIEPDVVRVVQVSWDWWRLGHVTSILLSHWPGGGQARQQQPVQRGALPRRRPRQGGGDGEAGSCRGEIFFSRRTKKYLSELTVHNY